MQKSNSLDQTIAMEKKKQNTFVYNSIDNVLKVSLLILKQPVLHRYRFTEVLKNRSSMHLQCFIELESPYMESNVAYHNTPCK